MTYVPVIASPIPWGGISVAIQQKGANAPVVPASVPVCVGANGAGVRGVRGRGGEVIKAMR